MVKEGAPLYCLFNRKDKPEEKSIFIYYLIAAVVVIGLLVLACYLGAKGASM